MNVNELQFYPFINTYPSIQQTFSSIENWKKPEVSQSCYRSCRVVVEWSCVYWAFITVNRSVFASVNGRYFIYDILLCMCLHHTLFFLFKVRRARVIKYKPQGIYWPMSPKRTKRKIKQGLCTCRLAYMIYSLSDSWFPL